MKLIDMMVIDMMVGINMMEVIDMMVGIVMMVLIDIIVVIDMTTVVIDMILVIGMMVVIDIIVVIQCRHVVSEHGLSQYCQINTVYRMNISNRAGHATFFLALRQQQRDNVI